MRHFTLEEGDNLPLELVKLSSLWSEFVTEVDDASQHVALQTPLIMCTLDDTLQVTNAADCLLSLLLR